MAGTYKFTADAVGNPEPITVQSVSKRVRVQQNDLSGTLVDFTVYDSIGGVGVSYPGGSPLLFTCPSGFYHVGDILGYIAVSSGSVEFKQTHDLHD